MTETREKQYWKSWETRPGDVADSEFRGKSPTGADFAPFSRRGFLESTGFALFASAIAGCSRQPAMPAFAPVEQSLSGAFGTTSHYASICRGCSAACGVLATCRDGRPIKLEGNPDHPLSRGGLCAVGQASILSLYDSHRLKGPLVGGKSADWEQVDADVQAALQRIRGQRGAVRFVTDSEIGPTAQGLIDVFLQSFADGRHVIYDPLSHSAILAAHEATHGAPVLPRYRIDQADVFVSFDADFLGTWISPVEMTHGYQRHRAPQGDPPQMSYHVQVESRLSLTGSNADRRFCVSPEELPIVMARLAVRLAKMSDRRLAAPELAPCSVPDEEIDALAKQLWTARGRSLVLCGSQDASAQILGNLLNELIGAYGATIDIERPSYQRRGRDEELSRLVGELRDGQVAALFIAGVNPLAELPGRDSLQQALARVPLVVSFANHLDETASVATYVCPVGDPLETWSDAEPVASVASIGQPVVRPLGSTRSLLASVAAWSNQSASDYELIRQHWQQEIYPRWCGTEPFDAFWNQTLHDGYVELRAPGISLKPFAFSAVKWPSPAPAVKDDALTLVLYPKVGMLDGRHAGNPWLQELPDPVTKIAWDNYACLSPAAAKRLHLRDGDVIGVAPSDADAASSAIELPVVIQPGQHDRVVAVALGYGRQAGERFADIGPRWLEGRPGVGPNGRVGVNAAALLQLSPSGLSNCRPGIILHKTGRARQLASTQQHHEITVPKRLAAPGIERRQIVEETTLAAYSRDRHADAHAHHELAADLWPEDHPYNGHRWGMVIDLNKCTGCSGCVIACQVENNVPVVGQDEVRRSREMHWLRVDRYYAEGPDGTIDVVHQPMMCQHCGNAPCETVCPVLATVHSEEGLNQQVYNRCVGTRYCANNCPYKARRFNWFEYARNDTLQNGVLNPDITVRTRGVMEKCSFCVQRIQEAKRTAKLQGRSLADGEVQPACQQSCPAEAIVFGDINDPDSKVAQLVAEPRAYRVLEEINVRPSVSYLRLVRHRETNEQEHAHV